MLHARYVYRQPRNRPNVATNSIYIYLLLNIYLFNTHQSLYHPLGTQKNLQFPNLPLLSKPKHPQRIHRVSMAWVAFHHHRRRLEDGHGDLCDRELLVVGFLRGDHRSIGGQHEVNARIGHQIGLEPACWIIILGAS